MSEERDLEHLRAEYARLVALLERHGIDWRGEPKPCCRRPNFDQPGSLMPTEY
jgi:hypothetical protein